MSSTFTSPAAEHFSSFFCHPTDIFDSAPRTSCICRLGKSKVNTGKKSASAYPNRYINEAYEQSFYGFNNRVV
jgi:hypothetical protein